MKNTLTQPTKPSALRGLASRLSVDPAKLLNTLKNTVFKGASDDELLALVVIAQEYKLNPLTKELYAFPTKGGGITPVVSIDGWITMANNHPQTDGWEFEHHRGEAGEIEAITCRIYRKDRSRPVEVTEYLAECQRGTEPWKQFPNRMLRHKAFKEAARYAFGFSGVVDEDEAPDTPALRNVTPQPAESEPVDPFAKKKAAKKAAKKAKPDPEVQLPQPNPASANIEDMPEVDWNDNEEGLI